MVVSSCFRQNKCKRIEEVSPWKHLPNQLIAYPWYCSVVYRDGGDSCRNDAIHGKPMMCVMR